ncbi:hypothetical protein AE749_11020 [Bacteroides fragilis]|nr:hypothetical protein AE749_11020 [Bacteroides fragilis]
MQKSLIFFWGGRLNCLTLRKIILLKTVKGFCCLMQEIKNGIDRTHLKQKRIVKNSTNSKAEVENLRFFYYIYANISILTT